MTERTSTPHLHSCELGQFLSANFPEPEPVLGRLLREGSLAMVHGPAGVGKTFFMLAMAVAGAYGQDFLGWRPAKPVPVVYVDGEMTCTDVQWRLKQLTQWVLEVVDTRWEPFHIVTPDLQPSAIAKIDTPDGKTALVDAVMRNSARLVFLDNLSCLTDPEDDNAASSWSAVQELLQHLRLAKIAAVIGHHSGKNGQQRGTSRRADILDLVLQLKPVGDAAPDGRTRVQVEFEKARHLQAREKESFIATLEPHQMGGLAWSRGELALPVGDRTREMLATGMLPSEIASELHTARSYVYRIQGEMLSTGELESPQSPRKSRRVSPVPSYRGGLGDNGRRPQGQDKGTKRGQQGTD